MSVDGDRKVDGKVDGMETKQIDGMETMDRWR